MALRSSISKAARSASRTSARCPQQLMKTAPKACLSTNTQPLRSLRSVRNATRTSDVRHVPRSSCRANTLVSKSVLTPSVPTALHGASRRSFSTGALDASKISYANWTVYKTKGAMSVSLINPTFTQTDKGNYFLSKPGALMLNFVSQDSAGNLDWSRKQNFALKIVDIGEFLAMEDNAWGPDKGVSLFHDTSKMAGAQPAGAQKHTKALRVMQSPKKDGTGFYMFFNLKETGQKDAGCSLTMGEYAIFKILLQNSVPLMLGWPTVGTPRAGPPGPPGMSGGMKGGYGGGYGQPAGQQQGGYGYNAPRGQYGAPPGQGQAQAPPEHVSTQYWEPNSV